MDFYTNVAVVNDTILYRGLNGGERVERREEFSPTLYVPAKKETKFKTLEGNFVEPVKLGSIKDGTSIARKLIIRRIFPTPHEEQ